MKTFLKNLLLIFFASSLLLTGCRKEESELIQGPEEEVLDPNSTVASLMQRVALVDGSIDNIIDGANCFIINLPVTVIVNGITVEINTTADYDLIEDIFDESDDDVDTIEIIFPITVTLADFTVVTINSVEEFLALVLTCPGEGESDDDIECLDFQYPITATLFNTVTEVLITVIIESDEELYEFLEEVDDNEVINIEFPIYVVLSDGTVIEINSLIELENVIEEAEDSCDEDDDNDHDDDDCEDCTTDDASDLLIACSPWFVDKLERDDTDLEDNYDGYFFTFTESGEIIVEYEDVEVSGTWTASGDGDDITIEISIPDLPDFNANWNLHELEFEPGEAQVDLRLGDDRLRFESDCEGGDDDDDSPDDAALIAVLTDGAWYITNYFDDEDQTDVFCDYTFEFGADGNAVAANGDGSTPGTWSTDASDSGLDLILDFGEGIPLDELMDDWEVVEFDENIIRLRDISGGDGSEDILVFGRTPIECDAPPSDLEDILIDGTWIVALYMDDTDNDTGNYAGYELNFNADGTVIAESDTDAFDGTWDVLSGGSTLLLDFGPDIPFDEFNDDWDVFSVEPTRVEVRDVSGGDGTLDILVFEKL